MGEVITYRPAANDNRRHDPRWMSLMKLLAPYWPAILPVLARARDAGDSYERVVHLILQNVEVA